MQKLAAALLKASALESRLTGRDESPEFKEKMRLTGAGLFRLVVMGEIKKGKSSFINALLNHSDLVPTSSNVATSTIFKIRYGREVAYKVYFTRESGKAVLPIGPEDLPKFGTEDGNPGNEKQVDFIEVSSPSPILESGIVIIDTPGLGGLFKEHKKITYQYVPKADAVFFVTDSVESPIGELETEYLKDVTAITKHVYFVQTKSCSVDEAAANARMRNNLDVLSRSLRCDATKLPYFMVDSTVRHTADEGKNKELLMLSGFPGLLSYVNQRLLPAKRTILAEQAVLAAAPILQNLKNIVSQRETCVNADTDEKRKAAEDALRDAQQALSDWEGKEKGQLLRTLGSGLDGIRREALQTLSKCRPNGEVQAEMEAMLQQADSKDAVAELLQRLGTNMSEYASKCLNEAALYMKSKTESLLTDLSVSYSRPGELSRELAQGAPDVNCSKIGYLIQDIANSSSLFANSRAMVYGASAGGIIAATVGGIIGSVFPVVGTIIGSNIGLAVAALWGGREGYRIQAEQELKSIKQQACNAISAALADMYNKMLANFEQIHASIKDAVQDAIAAALADKSADLKREMQDIQNRAKTDAETLAKQRKELEALKQQLVAIHRAIGEYLPQFAKTPQAS